MTSRKKIALILLALACAAAAGQGYSTYVGNKTGSGTFAFNTSGTVMAPNSTGTIALTTSNVATATALASNPTDCGSDTYATTIAANGNLTCASITNASTTATASNNASTIVLRDGSGNFAAGTITAALSGNATTATALAANPAACPGGQFVTDIDANGTLSCSTPSGAGDVVGPASSVDAEIVLFDSTSGKLIKRHSGTGLVLSTSGVASNLSGGTAGQLPVANGSTWAAATVSHPYDLRNVGISTSVSSNALTIALKQADGSTNCSSSTPCFASFRSDTTTSGAYNQRSITSSLSVVVSSGSTLGHTSAVATYFYVYAIDNAGTVELAVSSKLFDDGSVVTTTAEGGAGAADSATAIYSTSARTNVPSRLIGRLLSTQATAGTWASAMTEVSISPFSPFDRKGNNGGLSAPTGYIGEYVESSVTSLANIPATTNYGDVTSISLTAGDWDVTGIVWFDRNTASEAAFTSASAGIGTASGTSTTGLSAGLSLVNYTHTGGINVLNLVIPTVRMSLTATTTIYLKLRGIYSSNQPQALGTIRARRVR